MPEQPNVVLITVDSLRADVCGYLTGETDQMPTLTTLATDGIGFERAIAPGPSTPESMPAIFTGEYPPVDGEAIEGRLEAYRDGIRRHMHSRETIAEQFSRAGYATAAFTPNPFTSRYFGFDQGFDHFEDFMGSARSSSGVYDTLFRGFLAGNRASSMLRILHNLWQRQEVFKPWERYVDDVIQWASTADHPYFVWIFLMDAHNPYLPGAEYRNQSRVAQFHANYRFWRDSHESPFRPTVHNRLVTAYEDAVRYCDACLHRLTTELAADDPVVVIHGDHGEAFGEHGSYGHESYLYPENVHVPLVVHGHSAGRIEAPVSLRQMPNILADIRRRSEPARQSEFVVTRSIQGNQRAIYTRTDHWIAPDWSPQVEGRRSPESDELIRAVRPVDEHVRERARVTRAVAEVAGR